MLQRMIKGRERRSLLFGKMMRRFGLQPERDLSMNDVLLISRAINRCQSCGAVDRCENWMGKTEGPEGAEAFCPNAAAFRKLSKEEADDQ